MKNISRHYIIMINILRLILPSEKVALMMPMTTMMVNFVFIVQLIIIIIIKIMMMIPIM